METGQDALSLYLNDTDKDKLAKVYSTMVGSIMAGALSIQLKNNDYDGVAERAGTVKVNRLKTSVSNAYGTARGNQAGDKIENEPIFVNIDTDREIVEEIAKKDLMKSSIPDIIGRRQGNHSLAMTVELDKKYFEVLQNAAVANGLVDTSAITNVEDKILKLIQTLEALENEHIEKVDRELMELTLAPAHYDTLIKYMNTVENPNGQDYKTFHGVRVHRAVRQGFDAIVQVRGAVAQPVSISPYAPTNIPLSDDIGIALFYYYGTKAVMADTVFATALDADISA